MLFSESKGFEKLICVRAEAEFLDVIGTKVFWFSSSQPLPPWAKVIWNWFVM
jgi:hypothetical protein